MGDFNLQCCITKLSIKHDDPVVVAPIIFYDEKWFFFNKKLRPECPLSIVPPKLYYWKGTYSGYGDVNFDKKRSFNNFLKKLTKRPDFLNESSFEEEVSLLFMFEDASFIYRGKHCPLGLMIFKKEVLDFYRNSELSPLEQLRRSEDKIITIIFQRLNIDLEPIKDLNDSWDIDKERLDLINYVKKI